MKQKIKILHTEWSDGWGGQEIRIINEMLAIRAKGIEVFLACREHSQINKKAQEYNIKTFILPFNGSYDIKTIWQIYKIIKKHKIDIINTHSGKDTWTGGIAAKLAKVKFIRTRHLSNKINPSRINFINELADFIFTTGESVKEAMIKNNRICPSKIMSIPTGIDKDIFDPYRYDKELERKKLGIENNEIAIGILAVLRDFKRHDNFLLIAKKLIETHRQKKFAFLIAGEGPKRNSIEEQIKNLNLSEHVKMLGHIEYVAGFLKALDIFILPSDRNEGVPQSLIQSLLMELPSVSTTAGSIADLQHQNNFLISSPNVEEIFTNVQSLIFNPNLIKPNRKYIIDNFSKEAITDKIIKTYNRLMDEKNNTVV